MADYSRQDLEPRDVVTRALWGHLARGHKAFLDARAALGRRFASRFPGIAATCLAAGIDPAREPIPVRPAAHYAMGGIAVDPNGRSTIEGLWACGEAACTGLHGANRLASNSLLEAVVMARAVATDVAGARSSRARREPQVPVSKPAFVPPRVPAFICRLMSENVGVQRDHASLRKAMQKLAPIAFGSGAAADPAFVGFMIAASAFRRQESRGAHWRTDLPRRSPNLARRATLTLDEARRMLGEATHQHVPARLGA
jgi:L-aspartate oxidase